MSADPIVAALDATNMFLKQAVEEVGEAIAAVQEGRPADAAGLVGGIGSRIDHAHEELDGAIKALQEAGHRVMRRA